MANKKSTAKYQVGQRVRVKHSEGNWEGEITYRALCYTTDKGVDMWEYEVSNAPQDNAIRYGHLPEVDVDAICRTPGHRWHPLVWEHEVVEVIPNG